jgi:hypothetical protein
MARNFVLLCHLLSFDLDKKFPPLDGLFRGGLHGRGVLSIAEILHVQYFYEFPYNKVITEMVITQSMYLGWS